MARSTRVILSAHFEQFVQKQWASGRYSGAREVIRESLRQMEDREARLAVLQAELDVGSDPLD